MIPRCLLESRTKKNLLRVSRGRGGGGEGDNSLSLSFRSFYPVYFFLPSSPTWIVEGWVAKVGPAKHKLGILKFPVERSYFSLSIFFPFFFLLWVRDLPTISAPVQRFSSRIVARLIFKQVGEDFERSLLIDSSRKSGRRICLFLTISKEGA